MFVGYVNKNVQQIVYLQLNPKRYLLENNKIQFNDFFKDIDFKTLCDK